MKFSETEGKSIAVWGIGRETGSFLRHMDSHLPGTRVEVIVSDSDQGIDRFESTKGATVIGPERALDTLREVDLIVRSPGVSVYENTLAAVRAEGVEVTTATSLWMSERQGRRVVAVTGTKGKSTTSMLLSRLLGVPGSPVPLAGNIGVPALNLIDEPVDDWVVIELSSYQVADLEAGPEIAVLTNLFREHLDWHRSEDAYRADKLRLFSLPEVRTSVVSSDFEIPSGFSSESVLTFGGSDGWQVVQDGIRHRDGRFIGTQEVPLRGAHNLLNTCAALTVLDLISPRCPDLPDRLATARALPHRLETVAQQGDILWVGDSISTTPESTIAALEAYSDRSRVLIAGGMDRGQDYSSLASVLARDDVALIGLPDTGSRLVKDATSAGLSPARAVEAHDLEEAVHSVKKLLEPGGVVLLSPAAPSLNSYRNFEERGNHFRDLVTSELSRAGAE